MTAGRLVVATIRRDALEYNLGIIRTAAPSASVLAVVKANAYGHGISGALPALTGADAFAVACIEEGAALRALGLAHPVLILEGVFSAAELAFAASHRFDLVVHDATQLDLLDAAGATGPFSVWLKVDTGMNRLGFRPELARAARERLLASPAVDTVRLMTHLACADDPGHPMTADQLRRFDSATRGWPGERSIANSAGVFAHPAAHADWVRPGLALYGVSPFADRVGADLGLQAVMTLTSRLIAVRDVAQGESVGYGAEWHAAAATRVGIVGIGYGDGYPRHAGAGAEVLVDGVRCPLVGRVSMDMLAVDLGAGSDAVVGDEVVLWGDGLPVEEVAGKAATIPWTLLCGVTERVKLVYR